VSNISYWSQEYLCSTLTLDLCAKVCVLRSMTGAIRSILRPVRIISMLTALVVLGKLQGRCHSPTTDLLQSQAQSLPQLVEFIQGQGKRYRGACPNSPLLRYISSETLISATILMRRVSATGNSIGVIKTISTGSFSPSRYSQVTGLRDTIPDSL